MLPPKPASATYRLPSDPKNFKPRGAFNPEAKTLTVISSCLCFSSNKELSTLLSVGTISSFQEYNSSDDISITTKIPILYFFICHPFY